MQKTTDNWIAVFILTKMKMTQINDQVFEFLDANAFIIKNDQRAVDYINKMPMIDQIRYQYNQYDFSYSRSACTIRSCLGIISSLFNIKLNDQQEEDCFRFAEKNYWFREWHWNSSFNWARAATKRWNTNFPEYQVVFFTDVLLTDLFQLAIDKWLWVQTSIRASAAFFAALKRWSITTAQWMAWKIWHAIALYNKADWYEFLDSDKAWSKWALNIDTMRALRKNTTFYAACRVFLPLKKISELSADEYNIAMKLKNARSAAWHLMSKKKFRDQLHSENNRWRENAWL